MRVMLLEQPGNLTQEQQGPLALGAGTEVAGLECILVGACSGAAAAGGAAVGGSLPDRPSSKVRSLSNRARSSLTEKRRSACSQCSLASCRGQRQLIKRP